MTDIVEIETIGEAVDVDVSFAEFWHHPNCGIVISILTQIAFHGYEGLMDG